MFSKHFRLSELRKHRIALLMEQERSLFPATMVAIEREDVNSAYIAAHNVHLRLLQQLSPRDTQPLQPALVNQINEVRKSLEALHIRISELGITSFGTQERREFIKKCPTCPEGFLSTAWKCSLCKTRACSKCLGVKSVGLGEGEPDPLHECKPEDIESAKTIEAQTRPCPHCGVRVQKSEGCSQMWCTSCNNAFDWVTGRKVNGPVHNPHFHEYQRGQTADLQTWQANCENNNDPCYWPWLYGGQLSNLINVRVLSLTPAASGKIIDINRFMIERAVVARVYTPYGPNSYEDLRKKRMRQQLTDDAWSKQLSCRETRRLKDYRLRLLDELILAVARDTFGNILNGTGSLPLRSLEDLLWIPLENAKAYYNSQLDIYYTEYDLKDKRFINNRWVLSRLNS